MPYRLPYRIHVTPDGVARKVSTLPDGVSLSAPLPAWRGVTLPGPPPKCIRQTRRQFGERGNSVLEDAP